MNVIPYCSSDRETQTNQVFPPIIRKWSEEIKNHITLDK